MVHPNDLCATLTLELVEHFTHTQIKNRINELNALVKRPERESSAITKRWTLPLKEKYPDKTQYNAKKAEIKAIRSSLHRGTHVRPDFPANAKVESTISALASAAPASPSGSSTAAQKRTKRKAGESTTPSPHDGDVAETAPKKAKTQSVLPAPRVKQAKIAILENKIVLREMDIRKKREERLLEMREALEKLKESVDE